MSATLAPPSPPTDPDYGGFGPDPDYDPAFYEDGVEGNGNEAPPHPVPTSVGFSPPPTVPTSVGFSPPSPLQPPVARDEDDGDEDDVAEESLFSRRSGFVDGVYRYLAAIPVENRWPCLEDAASHVRRLSEVGVLF